VLILHTAPRFVIGPFAQRAAFSRGRHVFLNVFTNFFLNDPPFVAEGQGCIKASATGTCVAAVPGVLDTPRPLASLPADLLHACPVCGHEMAVMVADLPKGRLTQCASCGELDYRRKVLMAPPTRPGSA